MRSKKRSKKARRSSLSNAFINIVGRNMLQDGLLLSFLKQETGLKGACFPNLESTPAFDTKEPVIPQLLILDCQDIDNLCHSLRMPLIFCFIQISAFAGIPTEGIRHSEPELQTPD